MLEIEIVFYIGVIWEVIIGIVLYVSYSEVFNL